MNDSLVVGESHSQPEDLAFLSRTATEFVEMSGAAAQSLFERKLGKVTIDLYELTEKTVPEFICRAAEKLMNLESVYAMGFTRESELLGSASFYLPKGKTLASVKRLSGLLPICASCKKIRDDKGYWQSVESYLIERTDAQFSHGCCPECTKKLYPDYIPRT